ncbi:DNA repair and recombination protein RAD54B [Nematocida homosporus]|uniref:DNA repair and recombination protein RAD54B n=1 Tax=Nematocida homosporus TaxID=1912981 RepID=UPI00221E9803|nr:DNA repair and recombination protein RAD54B [Nematocida homosporus]KAI5185535.1 DNA repair and recombination protein RAD54B [Nematocida homosporus]
MKCWYIRKSNGDEKECGVLKKAGSFYILLSGLGRVIDRVYPTRSSEVLEGPLYRATTGCESLLDQVSSVIKELGRPVAVGGSGSYRRRPKVGPAPEGSLVLAPRAYIEPVHLKYFKDYQIEGVRFMFERLRSSAGAVLADEMGLGKTFQAIAIVRIFCKVGDSVLIVAPCSLVGVWERELRKWANLLSVFNGIDKHPKKYSGREEILLLSYERLATWKEATKHKFSLVVCDEAHRLRTGTSQAIAALKKLEGKRLLLTGTPFQNSLMEYKTLLALVDARAESAKGAAELSNIAGEAILRRKIERTSLSLPQKDEMIWLVRNNQYEETERLYNSFERSLGIQTLQKLRGEVSRSPSKWQLFYSLARSILVQGHSLVIISRFIDSVDQAKAVVLRLAAERDVPIKANDLSVFHGEMPVIERERSLAGFQSTGQKVIILSAKCGAEGLTLVKATRMIILDSDWNPANDLQAMARIWRLGQTQPVVIHRLFLMGTVEEHVLLVQLKKLVLQKSLEGEGEDELAESEISSVFVAREDSVVHDWLGCQCQPEQPNMQGSDGYNHLHTDAGLILHKRVNGEPDAPSFALCADIPQ